MQRLSFDGKNKKVGSCFAPSGHKGVEHFEPQLTQLAYFGERFREGNIRYNETFTDSLSFASMEDILTESFLQVVIVTMPEQHGKIKEEKHLIWALPLWLKVRGKVLKLMVKYRYVAHTAFSS